MAIGVDLDEVVYPLVSTHCLFLNKKYNLNLCEEDFTTYDFWNHYDATREQAINDFYELTDTELFMQARPLAGAKEGVIQLRKLDQLYIVTARQHAIEERTLVWINEHFPNTFSKVVFGNHFSKDGVSKPKSQLCKENGITLLIDDQIRYAQEVSKSIPVILKDRPWNRSYECERNVTRARNWPEIVSISEKLL